MWHPVVGLPADRGRDGDDTGDAADELFDRLRLCARVDLTQKHDHAGFDVNRDVIWAAAERLKMSPLGLVSVDETWSAFRLRMAE